VRRALDAVLDLTGRRGPRSAPAERRRVLVVGIDRPGNLMDAAIAELRRSHHDVTVATTGVGTLGKFQNLNALLDEHADALAAADWLLVVDDDVALPAAFLDRFLALAERAGLKLASRPTGWQPRRVAGDTRRAGAASCAPRRSWRSAGHRVSSRHVRDAAAVPRPADGLGAGRALGRGRARARLADRRRRRDAILHTEPVAEATAPRSAAAEARRFLAGGPYLPRDEAARTLRTHR
jgi:hypothetical protein